MFNLYVLFVLIISLNISIILCEPTCNRYVKKEGSNGLECDSYDNACATISYAMDFLDDDVICVDQGTYQLDGPLKFKGTQYLYSMNGNSETIIDGNSQHRCLEFNNTSSAHIEGFTMQNCFTTGNGSIYIFCDQDNSASPFLENLIIKESKADYGGGIFTEGCNTKLQDVVIQENYAVKGGGGLVCNSLKSSAPSHLTFTQVTIVDNSASYYENIYNMNENNKCFVNEVEMKNCGICKNGGNCNPNSGYCDCLPGSILESPQCEFCPMGHYSNETNSTVCTACEAGTYGDTFGLKDQNECQRCTKGTFNPNTGSSSINDCNLCEIGTYGDEVGLTECLPCNPGRYSDQKGSRDCDPCLRGKYTDEEGQSSCKSCPKGKFANETQLSRCFDCEFGTFSNETGLSICHNCETGTYSDEKGLIECKNCSKGTHNPNEGSISNIDCIACDIGKYTDEEGQSSCKTCPKGKFANETQLSRCFDCEFGTFSNETGLSICYTCEKGKYSDERGLIECKNCSKGTYNPNEGSISLSNCLKCQKGKYMDQVGQSFCLNCQKGTFNTKVKSKSEFDCKPCPMGNFMGEEGQSFCSNCQVGKFANDTGLSSCFDCEFGTFSNDTGLSICHNCETGTYSDEKGLIECKKCSKGTHNPNEGSISKADCIACNIGEYNDEDGKKECQLCPTGKYQNQNGQTKCLECLPGTYADGMGSIICQYCDSGTYQDMPGRINCDNCPFNTWQDRDASTKCQYCPLFSETLATGTASINECICSVGYYGKPGELCKSCPEGGICNQFNQKYPLPKRGYWNSLDNPEELTKCLVYEACPGYKIGVCNEDMGYKGVKCEKCETGFYRFEKECLECPSNNWFRLFLAFMIFVILMIILLFIAKKGENYFGSISILISFFQIITLFPSMLFNWPIEVLDFFQNLTFFNFNMDFLALECSLNLSFKQKWFLIQLLPIITLFFFVILYAGAYLHSRMVKRIGNKILNKYPNLCTKPSKNEQNYFTFPLYYLRYYSTTLMTNGMDKNDLKQFKYNCINSFIALLFIMYLILCLKILELFDCSKSRNSNSEDQIIITYTLNTSPEYKCYDDWWYNFLPFIIIFGILYIIGIPAFLVWSLWYHSKKVDEKIFKQRLGLLTNRFKKEWFFWEFVITIRKFLVVIFVLYLSNVPRAQLIIFNIIFLFSILMQASCNPFNTRPRNFLEFSLLTITQLILLFGMIFYSQEINIISHNGKNYLANFIIFLLAFSFVFWLVVVFLEIKSAFKKKNKKRPRKKTYISTNEQKFIQLIQKKSNFRLIIKYIGSINSSKLKKIYKFYNLLTNSSIEKLSSNSKFKNTQSGFLDDVHNIWNRFFITYLLLWYKNKANTLYKIRISKLISKFIEYNLSNKSVDKNDK
ncbi:insulin-like growth factor binding proteinn-terminal [Anaeramoeba flamelloides]|uniref:Insulin-like growth factor binding proteinn-terminal n=1 Tax=Anaeramoeba flamelloides TaxID=1746091 RepID=A0AAV7YCB0_9EUKA|nr:insulin-like growth factor binding proteinn-terminal [Anaeramoeba flamelloides]